MIQHIIKLVKNIFKKDGVQTDFGSKTKNRYSTIDITDSAQNALKLSNKFTQLDRIKEQLQLNTDYCIYVKIDDLFTESKCYLSPSEIVLNSVNVIIQHLKKSYLQYYDHYLIIDFTDMMGYPSIFLKLLLQRLVALTSIKDVVHRVKFYSQDDIYVQQEATLLLNQMKED